jgi:hypothetical protein
VDERVEERGEWWVPGGAARWQGTFLYDPAEGAELRLSTVAHDPVLASAIERFPLLHGQPTTGKVVTLLSVDATDMQTTIPGGVQATLRPWRTFFGVWFEPGEEIAFDRLLLRLEGLDAWANVSGFTLQSGGPRGYSVDYKLPDDVGVGTAEAVVLKLSFVGQRRPSATPVTAVELSQQARLEIVATGPQRYQDLDELVRQIRNFFMFVTRERVAILSLQGELAAEARRGEEVESRRQMVSILYGSPARDEAHRRRPRPRELLFTLTENGDSDGSRLGRWLGLGQR